MLRLLLLPLLMLSACRAEPPVTVFGYHAWWMGDAWHEVDLDVLDELLFFDLEVAPDGTVAEANGWPDRWLPMAARAQAQGTRIVPTFSLFDADIFTAVFTDPAAQDRLFAAVIEAVEAVGADGVHLDFELFEDVPDAARDAYAPFVQRVKDALGREAVVSVYTLALDDFNRYDERALARAADFLVVQGYDFHWRGSTHAGPNAALDGWDGLDWAGVVARYDSLGVPRRQILMATPLFGYEWPTVDDTIGAETRGEGRIIAFENVRERVPETGVSVAERVASHGMRRDPASGSPYYAFEDETGWHQGWFDDPESLRAKFAFVREHGLGGVALFPLGYDGGATAELVREAFPERIEAAPNP